MKLVINRCYGGFSLSPAAAIALFEEGWKELGTPVAEYYKTHDDRRQSDLADWRKSKASGGDGFCMAIFSIDESHVIDVRPRDRSDKRLVEIVERLGEAADGAHAKLKVIEIPDGVEWSIEDYDGKESVHEVHREWR